MARPRKFDEVDVVNRVMDLFWANGLEGTSLEALEKRTGLNRSSLYSTFGGKLDLFCKALDAYSAGPCQDLFRSLREQRGGAALLGYLQGMQTFVGSTEARKGCLMVNTSLELVQDRAVRQRVDAHFKAFRALITKAYCAGLEDNTVNKDLSAEEAADWLLIFSRGVLTGSASGERFSVLARSIEITIKQLGLKQV